MRRWHQRSRGRAGRVAVAAAVLLATSCSSSKDRESPVPEANTTTIVTTPAELDNDVVADRDLYIERTTSSPRAGDTAALGGLDYANDLQAEQQGFEAIAPAPIGGFRYKDLKGRYNTIVDGIRVTTAPSCSCPRRATVWLVGGSAAFGLGQRDDHTIASDLVRIGGADGIALEVVNLSLPGWTRWQELQGVLARLASEAPRPDLVISYGGFNDVIALLFEQIATGGASRTHPTVWDPRISGGVLDAIVDGRVEGPSAKLGKRTGAAATKVAAQMRAAVHAAGAEMLFVHQPDALASPGQAQDLLDWIGPALTPEALESAMTGLDAALAASAEATAALPDGLDLRNVYDGADEPYFPDSVHTNEAGANIVAEAIWRRAAPLIDDR